MPCKDEHTKLWSLGAKTYMQRARGERHRPFQGLHSKGKLPTMHRACWHDDSPTRQSLRSCLPPASHCRESAQPSCSHPPQAITKWHKRTLRVNVVLFSCAHCSATLALGTTTATKLLSMLLP